MTSIWCRLGLHKWGRVVSVYFDGHEAVMCLREGCGKIPASKPSLKGSSRND